MLTALLGLDLQFKNADEFLSATFLTKNKEEKDLKQVFADRKSLVRDFLDIAHQRWSLKQRVRFRLNC